MSACEVIAVTIDAYGLDDDGTVPAQIVRDLDGCGYTIIPTTELEQLRDAGRRAQEAADKARGERDAELARKTNEAKAQELLKVAREAQAQADALMAPADLAGGAA